MVLKTYVLSGSILAGAPWTKIDELTTPAGTTRKVVEIRPWISATSGIRIRLYVDTTFISEMTAEVISSIKYPYPADVVVPAGLKLVLEGTNPTASAAQVILELIVDETTR